MPLYQVIVLSIVQGVTELLPVSSSGHLFLTSWLLGWKDEGLAFDIALHLGTLAAVVVYFFRDWVRTIATGLRLEPAPPGERDLLWKLAAASLPIGILGLKFKDLAETSLRSPWVIGAMLIGVGVLMWVGEYVGRRRRESRL
jgi:undecaprenyl-diphosphatase